jgi:arylsulfatase A-like enzyme
MNRRLFSMAALATALIGMVTADVHAAEQPNILFIFADDMTYEAVHALGNDVIQTPNLDRLVKQGTSFTHAYNQGGWHGAVCVASRTMLNTGRFLWHAREREAHLKEETEHGHFWSQLLHDAGYDTYMSGKWHVKGIAPKDIFGTVRHVRPGMPGDNYRTTKLGYNRPQASQPDDWKPWDIAQGGFWAGGKHWSEVLGDDGVDFLAQASTSDRPFFMYLAFNAPHDPRQSPKDYVDRYPLKDIAVPEDFIPRHPHDVAMGCGPGLRDEDLAPFPRTPRAVQVHRQEYYAIITHMDAQIGRMLDALEKNGQSENTYIVFTADHGLAAGHHGLMGKQNMYDHSVRVPLTVVGPGIAQNKRISTPVYLQDVMPTSLEWAGAKTPGHVEFKSLTGLFRAGDAPHYDGIYGAYMDRQRMVTEGGFKLIHYPKIEETLLFDLTKDPLETKNLAGNPAFSERKKQLWARLTSLQTDVGDSLKTNP